MNYETLEKQVKEKLKERIEKIEDYDFFFRVEGGMVKVIYVKKTDPVYDMAVEFEFPIENVNF